MGADAKLTEMEKAYILARFEEAKAAGFADVTAKYRDNRLISCETVKIEDRQVLAGLYKKADALKE